jgi:hypothetical protein
MIVLFHENVLLLSTNNFIIQLKIYPDRCPESDITLARYKNRWGKTELLLSFQIGSFIVQ